MPKGDNGKIFQNKFYHAWHRCNTTNCSEYGNYGGRGISMEWRSIEEFAADMLASFKEHCTLHGVKNTTLERIDVNGNYSKQNCKWATHKEQSRNRRNNKIISFNGRALCVAEWSDVTGINAKTIYTRIYNGWSIEKALSTPVA